MNQTKLTRAVLEELVGKVVTVTFKGEEISVCPGPTYPSNKGIGCVDCSRYRPCGGVAHLEPFSYGGGTLIDGGDVRQMIYDTNLRSYRYMRVHDYGVEGGNCQDGSRFVVPVVPVEEGEPPYLYSIIVDDWEREEFVYSIERKLE